jgi:hypothetical protein
MVRRASRAVVGLVLLGLVMGLFALPSGAAVPRAQQGVNKDSIDVVLITPDLDKLRAQGVNVGDSSNADFVARFKGMVDAYGPINGRTINIHQVGWDPLDATSFDKACIAATQDNKPLVVINGSGYQTSSIPCVSVDNKTPYFSGDMVYSGLQKASGKNLVSIALPAEVSAAGAVDLIAKTKAIPKTAKIGILGSNVPSIKAATQTLQANFKKKGYNVASTVELNGLAADNSVLARESAAAADTFQSQGIDVVINDGSWTSINGYFGEADKIGYKPKLYGIDGQANTCTPFAATRTNPLAAGATCITAWDARTEPDKTKIKPDNALEAKCRAAYEKASGKTTLPGGASGTITGADGTKYNGDFAPPECMIANLLLPAIKKAGKNVTWDKVWNNLMATTSAPAAYLSDGKGGFGKNKPYFANPVMHFTEMAGNTTASAQDPTTKLFNGCAVPAPCFVSTLVDGKDWYPVSTSAASG